MTPAVVTVAKDV